MPPICRPSCRLSAEDSLDGLAWAERLGGLPALIRRSEANLATIAEWVASTPWVDFLAREPATRSCTSICLAIVDPAFEALDAPARAGVVKKLVGRLEGEGVAYDVATHRRGCGCGAAPRWSGRTSRRSCRGSTGRGARRARGEAHAGGDTFVGVAPEPSRHETVETA